MHCPDCGRTFVMEFRHDTYGQLKVCLWCLTKTNQKGVITRDGGIYGETIPKQKRK